MKKQQLDPQEIKVLESIFRARQNKEAQVKEHIIMEDLEKAGFKESLAAIRQEFLKLEEKGYICEELHSERGYLLTETAEKLFTSCNTKDQSQDKKEKFASYPLRVPASLYKQVRIKLANEGKTLREVLMGALTKYLNE